jgi:hypothetical protein
VVITRTGRIHVDVERRPLLRQQVPEDALGGGTSANVSETDE